MKDLNIKISAALLVLYLFKISDKISTLTITHRFNFYPLTKSAWEVIPSYVISNSNGTIKALNLSA